MSQVLYTNGRLLRNHQLVKEDLWVVDGKIANPQGKADKTIDMQGAIIAPGYIDLQVNGAFGCDFSKDGNGVSFVAEQLSKRGVTSFLATVVTSSPENYTKILPRLQPTRGLLGIHLEGPYFNPAKTGAHTKELLRAIDREPEGAYGSLAGVKMVTLAPELPNASHFIRQLVHQKIVVSAGHTLASFEEGLRSFDQGVTCVTHLFNGMTPLTQREPGIALATLTTPGIYYSIIADGLHLHPALIKMAWKINPEGLILVSDSIAALGLGDGMYSLGEQSVQVKEGKALLTGTQTLAGSVISLDQAVRNFRAFTGCSLVEAIEAATLKPAKLLGIANQKGTLAVGADADLIFLDDNLNHSSSSSSTSS